MTLTVIDKVAFQSTPSVGRATSKTSSAQGRKRRISIRPPWEGDLLDILFKRLVPEQFQSTPSVGRATTIPARIEIYSSDFNPRPPWGGRQYPYLFPFSRYVFQSTPSVGGRHVAYNSIEVVKIFQSTPSGEATIAASCISFSSSSISIHALRGGDKKIRKNKSRYDISIHALRGEGDPDLAQAHRRTNISIHALRGEGDFLRHRDGRMRVISIHALRGEGDGQRTQTCGAFHLFQSTPSVGGRHMSSRNIKINSGFQSTPSVGRATEFCKKGF